MAAISGTARLLAACFDMAKTTEIVDPADCRRRAQQLRERAESSTIAEADLLEAADTWDELARHAESLREAYRQARPLEDRKAE
jgi:hypothetical protein